MEGLPQTLKTSGLIYLAFRHGLSRALRATSLEMISTLKTTSSYRRRHASRLRLHQPWRCPASGTVPATIKSLLFQSCRPHGLLWDLTSTLIRDNRLPVRMIERSSEE